MTEQEKTHAAGIDRRTVMRAAAWSVPVLAVAVASPANAASGDPTSQLVSDPAVGQAGRPWAFGILADQSATTRFRPGTTVTLLIDRTSVGGDAFALYDGWQLRDATVAEIAPTAGPSPQLVVTLTGILPDGFTINTTGQTGTTVTIDVIGPQGDIIGGGIVRSE